MTILCRTEMSISLPRHLLWSLITDQSSRHLWQPDVISAVLESGYGGGKGSHVQLQIKKGSSNITVSERVIRSRVEDHLVVVQSWPKFQIHNKFILSSRSQETTNLILQKRHKDQKLFVWLGNGTTHEQLEAVATQELLGIKNLSAQLHSKVAEQAIQADQT